VHPRKQLCWPAVGSPAVGLGTAGATGLATFSGGLAATSIGIGAMAVPVFNATLPLAAIIGTGALLSQITPDRERQFRNDFHDGTFHHGGNFQQFPSYLLLLEF
jgi:hypothetical protein